MRNLAATLGVAAVVAITATLTPGTEMQSFHRVWWLIVASGITVTALSSLLPRQVRRANPAPQTTEAMIDEKLAEIIAEVPA
jgi:hypothetical protein